ncbi:MAG TPA: hypothetical protein VNI84_17295 [Pyrinomonadaceae bacterium]|nr:hypothetical protein [Pyrinomonadaceae bacterium]
MENLIKTIVSLTVIYAVILTCACPQKSAIRRANEAGYQLAGAINDAQKAVEAAYDARAFSRETAIKLNTHLRTANHGSARLNDAIRAARQIAGGGAALPQSKIDALNLIFSEQVITPILEILNELKITNAGRAPALFAAIQSVKTLILVISSAFPQKSSAVIKLEGSEIYG